MSQEAHYFRVGLFVLLGAALAVGAALLIGGGGLFQKVVQVETVFAESVQGIEIGSPVKFRGVKLGSVSRIGMVSDHYKLPPEQDLEFGNMVVVQFQVAENDFEEASAKARGERLMNMVDRGLRLRITPLGITGTAFIEADYVDPVANPPIEIPWEPKELYIPSIPSRLRKFASAAEAILDRLEKLDIEQLLGNLNELITSMDSTVGAIDAGSLSKGAAELLDEMDATFASIREGVESANLEGVSKDVQKVLEETNSAIALLRKSTEGASFDLEVVLENLRVTTENLRALTNTLQRQPSLLLRSGPPGDEPGVSP